MARHRSFSFEFKRQVVLDFLEDREGMRELARKHGTQYASEGYREILAQHGFIGSMSRRGNPYDNAKAGYAAKELIRLPL